MDVFLVEANSNACFTSSQYILITFVLDILMYLASLKLSLVWLGGCTIFYEFLICPYFGPLLHFFGPFWVIFGVEVRFKNIFGTYLHRLTTFILEV